MREVELGEIASYQNGYAFKPDDWSKNGLPIIRIQNLNDPVKDYNHYEGDDIDERYFVQDGDVLIAWSASLGVYVWNRGDAWLNQHTFKVNFENDEVDKSYFVYAIQEVLKKIENKLHGSTMKHITKKKFLKLKIPLPSLSEQKAIVAKLDRAQRLIDIDREMLAKYDDLIQSVFLEMFGDPVTNPKEFDKGTIRDIVSETKYGTNKKAHETEGEYPVIRMGNLLYNGEWDFSDMKYCDLEEKELPKYLVYKGDVLFNRTNSKELVGKTGVYREDEPIAYAGYLIRVRPNEKGTSEYISGYLNCPHGKLILEHMCKNIVGMANINAQELQDIEILIPPIELQKKYEQKINEIRNQKSTIKAEIKKSEEFFSSLVQGAFG